jgi:hypothetical protein
MSMLNFHPAPGLGDLLPGEFVVPQNPIRDAGTPLVPSNVGLTKGRPYKVPKLGDLMPGKFAVPQNPLITTLVNGYGGMPTKKAPASSCPAASSSTPTSTWMILGGVVAGALLLSRM